MKTMSVLVTFLALAVRPAVSRRDRPKSNQSELVMRADGRDNVDVKNLSRVDGAASDRFGQEFSGAAAQQEHTQGEHIYRDIRVSNASRTSAHMQVKKHFRHDIHKHNASLTTSPDTTLRSQRFAHDFNPICGFYACVAVANDGTAVAWGHGAYGGDASSVDLTNVAAAMCGGYACVAVKNDGTAVAWGHGGYGGDASSVDLTNVAAASCGRNACVAVKNDGTAEAWGDHTNIAGGDGGDASGADLTNVAAAMCGGRACVAVKNDGTAVSWGRATHGGDASSVDLTNLASAMCGEAVCVAVKNDGTAVAWAYAPYGGDASSVDLTNVAAASCGWHACVAVKNDGTAEAWGDSTRGGDASSVDLTNVAAAMCGDYIGCVAVKNDGTAVAWGDASYAPPLSVDLTNVAAAMCGRYACVAVKNDGTAVAWGHGTYGGDASSVDLTNVAAAMCGGFACVAVKNDGTAVAWGTAGNGGDASSVDLTNLAAVGGGDTPSPTPSPMLIPTGTPTSSPTSSPTKAAPTPTPPTSGASATGDPHMENIHGERFDLMKPGNVVLVQIPRGKTTSDALLIVEADARRLGVSCADLYFQTLNITGAWADTVQAGGFTFTAQGARDEAPKWTKLGPLEFKVAHGHTSQGARYLNFYVKHLKQAGVAVGGLLGDDDHTEASTPASDCVKTMALKKADVSPRNVNARSQAAAAW